MVTALNLYGLTAASTTLTTAAKLSNATGGTGSISVSTLLGTALGYGELYGLGNAGAWAAAGSIGGASGHGFLWDVTTLEGQQIIAGNWTPTMRLKVTTSGVTATLYMQAYKRTSGGVFTLIGTMSLSGQALTATATNFPLTTGSLAATSFATGDKLYLAQWLQVTSNTSGDSANNVHIGLSSTSVGLASFSELDSPGFQASGSNPVLSTSPASISFTALVGGVSPSSQNDTLSETAGVGTSWTSSISYGSGSGWLAISPTSGTLAGNGNATIAYTCTTGALAAGTYTATVTYTATTGGATATVAVTFTVSAISSLNPYGVTVAIFNTNLYQYSANLFPDCATLGIRAIRFQQDWGLIESPRGTYDWSALDDFVGRCNAAGIDVQFPIRNGPSWAMTVLANPSQTNRTTCNANFPNDKIFQMDPTLAAGFASVLAQRYNGLSTPNPFASGTNLFLNVIEIGNEDFDVKFDCNASTGAGYLGQEARLAKWYYPVVQAVAPVIRAKSPKTLIGGFGMWWKDINHRVQFLTDMYNAKDSNGKSIASYLDFWNFHCYIGDPTVDESSLSVSLPHILQQLNAVVTSFGDNKHFWVTEIGWTAQEFTGSAGDPTEAQEASYYHSAMDIMRSSGIVDRFNLFSMAYSSSGAVVPAGKSITQPPGLSPHFWPSATTIQSYAQQFPSWNTTSSPVLSDTPASLSFTALVGGGNPSSKNDTLSEIAGVGTAWTSSIAYTNGSGWLAISPTSGTLAGGGSQVMSYTCTTGALAVGTYTATVTTTATTGGATDTVAVTFTVTATANPVLSTSPTTLSFSGTAAGSSPASQNDTLSETAGTATAWTSNIDYGVGNANWLVISPDSGSLAGLGTQVVSYTCSPTTLVAGTYTATVTYTATTGGATATVTVTFTVAAATPVLTTSPTALSFSAVVGQTSPPTKNSTLSETAGTSTAWTSSIAYGSGSGWLAISPTSGTLAAFGTRVVGHTCTTGALTVGTYTATVTYTATTGGATATVAVTFIVTAVPAPVTQQQGNHRSIELD